ncbi:hypothetical protein PybrP1_013186 [[Pythium] brassicae (nom. inval.)]|nr:hypothetical protein PybrP1_013186 [[Pythium] brassicae (nom. inval.)]
MQRCLPLLLLLLALAAAPMLAMASGAAKAHCASPAECCELCGDDSYRCARGPCSVNAITKGFFFISMPQHLASVWDVVFVAYGMVPSLVPVVLALELLLVKRSWLRVFAFLFIPIIAAINTAVLVKAFGECAECVRPCGTCLGAKGFPSGHSANSVGMFLWLLLETLLGVGASWPRRRQVRVTLASFALFAPVPYSRVYLGDHTPLQTVIGGLIGAIYAVLYFVAVRSFLGRKLAGASRWLAGLRVPVVVENDFYVEPASRAPAADDLELAALKEQAHPTYN